MKQENELSKSAQLGDSGPKLDLGFKEGQTITLNIGVRNISVKNTFTAVDMNEMQHEDSKLQLLDIITR